jgi:trk system potassium uptake protein TrkA
VRWTADEMLRRLVPEGAHSVWSDPSGHLLLADVHFDPAWVGHSVKKLEEQTGARIAFVTRYGDAMLVTSQTALQDGDVLHVIVNRTDLQQVADTFAAPPGPESSS